MRLSNRGLLSRFLLVLLVFALGSCSLFNPEEDIPVYLHIDSITVQTNYLGQGSNSSNISDAWVYINDAPIGAFELPATIPILANGETNIIIFPGIKNSGITEYRKRYIPYTTFTLDTLLTPGTSFELNPVLTYDNNLIFAWMEDFEDISVSLDSISPSHMKIGRTSKYLKEGNASGLITLNTTDHILFKGINSNLLDLPRTGQEVYLELDYLCNQEFSVGLRSYNSTSYAEDELVTITPTNKDGELKWNKLYIEMTDLLQSTNLAFAHQVYFEARTDSSLSENGIIAMDNIKVVHVP